MYFVNPKDSERYALRTLLLYSKGCKNFEDIRTVNGVTLSTFNEACISLGYLDDDSDAFNTLLEAASFSTAKQMRELFVVILLNCCPANPGYLWDSFRDEMTYDLLYDYRIEMNDAQIQFNDELYNLALFIVNCSLERAGRHVSEYFGMPDIREPMTIRGNLNRLIRDELAYDVNLLKATLNDDLPKLNTEQKLAYSAVIDRSNKHNTFGGNCFFVDGPGGTGKTFVYKLILELCPIFFVIQIFSIIQLLIIVN
jgi:hypothetical protein